MSKRAAVKFACAVAGVVSGLTGVPGFTSIAKAGTFVDNFNNGNILNSDSITNFWNVGALNSGGGGATINTSSGNLVEGTGPGASSTLSYTGPTGQQGGVFEYSNYNASPTALSPNTFNEFNFLKNAELITMTAAPGTSLIPGTDYTSGSSLDSADTWLGVDGGTGGFTLGGGGNRFEVALTNQNTPFFILKNASSGTVYSVQKFGWPTANASNMVTSMFIYLDGTQEASDHLYINFGETVQNSTGAVSTFSEFTLPFDVGTSGGAGASKTQAVLDQLVAGLTNGAGLGIELQNNAGDTIGNESLSISQITDINSLVYTAGGTSSGSWFSGVAGINAVLTNFNTPAGVAGPFTNGASVLFDDKVASGGHNGGVFTLNLSTAAGVYPTSVNVSGGTAYTFIGIGGIHGIGGLNLLGTSTLTLTNVSNTYSGATNIGSGTLIAGAASVLSPNSAVLIAGGTLDASGFNNTIGSLNISSGTLKLGVSTLLTDNGTAVFGGALNLVGTPASLPDILMTYQSATGTFATNNLPAGDGLAYLSGMLEVISAGPSNLTWVNGSTDGLWNTTSVNWNTSTPSTVAYSDTSNAALSAGDNVAFTDSNGGPANYNVSIAATVHPTSVTVTTSNTYTFSGAAGIGGPGSLTLSGTGSLVLNESNSYTGGTNVSGGTLVLGVVGALPTGALTIGSGGTVVATNLSTGLTVSSLSNSGKFDLGNNKLTITTADLTTISNEVAAGFNGGTWNGSGATPEIFSSAAASNTGHLTALGVMQTGTGVFVKYTYYGDANLDGKVDGSDYSLIDSDYLNEQSGPAATGWANGDFNYDGVVNGSDYTLIDNAFNSQGAAFTTQIASPTAEPTAQIAGSGATSAVPEPTTLGLLGIGLFGLLGRRNRRAL